ncbi:HTH-type transcriptional activator RhaS [Paenibacillus plantiphilus]|uniref:HTH-type transcriptional activator RhaS n=1 Tax=Paenibacillus plantiphilus TaxID=2905650 RepID=A0ABN8G6Y1_9BACL|nr:GyrI-like domain-containing protein [Paenibacillus plantiphilus]CAH1201664.1 HTH-type transcriptional activator RhaS [Paenibacillus plantiphilus]
MKYMDSVTKAVDYIENHLSDPITAVEVAQLVGYSPYHFHRIFQSVTRNSVSEYIRRRRLTHAAYELFHTKRRIVEIAVNYQFESQAAFTRAFQQMFSISPGQFRKQTDMKDTLFRAMERLPLDEAGFNHLRDGLTLEPYFITKDTFYLVGMEIQSLNSGEVGKLWSCFRKRLAEIDNRREPTGSILYALIELTGAQWEVSYTTCVEVSEEGRIPEGMVYKVLPAETYAVFSHRGSLARISDTFQYIYNTWLPKSGRLRTNAPEFARFDDRYRGPANDDSEFDIYIPVGPIEMNRSTV